MGRLALIAVVGGGFLAFMGYQEFAVSRGTTSEASLVELADLENGK
jgi:hypothetical protein